MFVHSLDPEPVQGVGERDECPGQSVRGGGFKALFNAEQKQLPLKPALLRIDLPV